MVYIKSNNTRIQDPNQINYVKNILEASAQQCQQGGMYAPEIYIATAQRIADTYSLQDSNYPRITFNAKEQRLKGQDNSVPELTASIGDRTSTSYFLIKDSLPQGTKASPEQLTHLRPDIVSARIAANLGIVQPLLITTTSATIPPIDRGVPVAIPTPNAPIMSKAQAMAQTTTSATPSPQPPTQTPNSAVAGLAALATAPEANNKTSLNPPVLSEEENFILNNSTAPIANQIPNVKVTAPPVLPIPQQRDYSSKTKFRESRAQPEPIHNPQMAKGIKTINQNLQAAGNLNQSIGKALKDMAKGEINPIQLYGDTLNIIGSFINGIPTGIQEARLKSIVQQMKLVEEKKRAIDLKMERVGDDFITSENKSPISNTDIFNQAVPKPEPELKTSAAPPSPPPPTPSQPEPQTQSQPKPADMAINKLLKSNASLDDKLDAIEKTLDKMLEELIKIEKNLEAIQASLESEAQATPPAPLPNPEDMVVETEAKTEVQVVANDPMAEVSVRTEIDTEVVAEAKTETEAAEEIEVPEITIDSTPDLDWQMAELISSYGGDLDQLNSRLKAHKLQIDLSEDRQRVSVSEIDNGIAFSVFEAQADEEGWKVFSQINDAAKLDILERFVEAEGEVLINTATQPEQAKKPEKVTKEEPSLFL